MLIAERKRVKKQINQIHDPEDKREPQAQYWNLNTFVREVPEKIKEDTSRS